MAKQYDAFISYKHGSILPFSKMLARSLRTYATPLFARPRNIFRDEDHLVPGPSLPALVDQALRNSEYLILLASPGAANSPWVERELRTWCEELDRTQRIIIVLVEGSLQVDTSGTLIDWSRTTAVPRLLERYLTEAPLFVDLSGLTSASEVDENNPAFKDAVTKIAARLRGLDPQELLGFEILQHRRRIRVRNLAVGLLATLTATSAVAGLYANVKRIEQQRTANAAIASSLAAQVRSDPARSNDERNALLARQAYVFAERSGKPLSDSVYQALRTATSDTYFTTALSTKSEGIHVAGSASGRVLASAGDANLIRIWANRLAGDPQTLTLETDAHVSVLGVDATGQRLAAGIREDASIRLWDLSQVSSGQSAPTVLPGHDDALEAFAFDASGIRLASASRDGTVRIWNTTDPTAQPEVLRHSREVIAVTFVGDQVLTGTVDGTILSWSRDGTNVTLMRSLDQVSILRISPLGRWAAYIKFGSAEAHVRDLNEPTAETIVLKSPAGEITAADFSPSGEQLAIGTSTGDILVWTFGVSNQLTRIPSGHSTGVIDIAFIDGHGIVTTGLPDDHVRARYLTPRVPASAIISDISEARFSNNDQQIIGVDRSGKPVVRMLSSAPPAAANLGFPASTTLRWRPVRDGFMSLDFEEKTGAIWSMRPASAPSRRFQFAEFPSGDRAVVAPSDDGRLLVLVDQYDMSVWLVDLMRLDEKVVRLPDQPIRGASPPTLAPDGTPAHILSVGSRDWSAPVAISPDNTRLAIGAGDGTVRVWSLSKLDAAPLVLRELGRWPLSLAFSFDGDLIAVGNAQRTIGVWSFSKERVMTLRGHTGRVDAVAFAPNRRLLASGGPDRRVLLWDLDAVDPQPIAIEQSAAINSLGFSQSGEMLVTASIEGAARVWIFPAPVLAQYICEIVSRNLTYNEWRGSIGGDVGYERTCPTLPVHSSLLEEARALAMTGRLDQARSLIVHAISLDPEHTVGWSAEVDRAVAENQLAEAEELARGGEVERSTTLIKSAVSRGAKIASDPGVHARHLAAEGLLKQAMRLTRADDARKAISLLNRSIELEPTAEAYAGRAAALVELGESDQALVDVDSALSLEPDRWGIHAQRAALLHGRQDWQGALEGYNRALELIQDAKGRLGDTPASMVGRVDRTFMMKIRLHNGETPIFLARADASRRLGDIVGAIADYNRVLSHSPWNRDALLGRGSTYAANGQCDKAVADATAVLERDRRNSTAIVLHSCWQRLGNDRRAQGDLDGALEAYRQDLEITQKLTAAEPGNAQWQFDFAISLWNLASVTDEGQTLRNRALSLFYNLDAQSTLSAEQQSILAGIERDVAAEAFAAGDYARALAIQRSAAGRLESKGALQSLAEALGQLSFYALFARDFLQARDAAERALKFDAAQRWIETNLAHALMFTGAVDEARTLYLLNQGITVFEDSLWEKVVLTDFVQLQQAGLSDPLMGEIERRFEDRPSMVQ